MELRHFGDRWSEYDKNYSPTGKSKELEILKSVMIMTNP